MTASTPSVTTSARPRPHRGRARRRPGTPVRVDQGGGGGERPRCVAPRTCPGPSPRRRRPRPSATAADADVVARRAEARRRKSAPGPRGVGQQLAAAKRATSGRPRGNRVPRPRGRRIRRAQPHERERHHAGEGGDRERSLASRSPRGAHERHPGDPGGGHPAMAHASTCARSSAFGHSPGGGDPDRHEQPDPEPDDALRGGETAKVGAAALRAEPAATNAAPALRRSRSPGRLGAIARSTAARPPMRPEIDRSCPAVAVEIPNSRAMSGRIGERTSIPACEAKRHRKTTGLGRLRRLRRGMPPRRRHVR